MLNRPCKDYEPPVKAIAAARRQRFVFLPGMDAGEPFAAVAALTWTVITLTHKITATLLFHISERLPRPYGRGSFHQKRYLRGCLGNYVYHSLYYDAR